MTQFKTEHITIGDTILDRLHGEKLPKELKQAESAFRKSHGALVDAHAQAVSAEAARDEALAHVTKSDTKLDGLLTKLAAVLPAHGLGSRTAPFASFSEHTPSELKDLAHQTEAQEAARIAAAIKKTKPHKDVVAVCDEVIAAARAVPLAIRAVAVPQRVYATALGKRDALLPEWVVARTRLERKAIGAWADEPEKVRAFFAPPDPMERPVTKRPKKDKAAAAAPEPAKS